MGHTTDLCIRQTHTHAITLSLLLALSLPSHDKLTLSRLIQLVPLTLPHMTQDILEKKVDKGSLKYSVE